MFQYDYFEDQSQNLFEEIKNLNLIYLNLNFVYFSGNRECELMMKILISSVKDNANSDEVENKKIIYKFTDNSFLPDLSKEIFIINNNFENIKEI